jgi:hypothetical protein
MWEDFTTAVQRRNDEIIEERMDHPCEFLLDLNEFMAIAEQHGITEDAAMYYYEGCCGDI